MIKIAKKKKKKKVIKRKLQIITTQNGQKGKDTCPVPRVPNQPNALAARLLPRELIASGTVSLAR
jgi:hypothetical protein